MEVSGSVPISPAQSQPPAEPRQLTSAEAEQRAAAKAPDPLSRPFTLPSGGLFYDGHDGQVIISPTRGEQEEILAGAEDNEDVYFEVASHLMSQCVDWRGIADPLTFDWVAVLIHFLAVSQGSDTIALRPTHAKPVGCGKAAIQTVSLAELPCRKLRRAAEGEEPTWPPSVEDEDPEEAILRELEGDPERGSETLAVPPSGIGEPFKTKPLPHTNEVVSWRFLRRSDVTNAQEYASRMDDGASLGKKRNTFLQAAMIVAINGKRARLTESVAWIRRTPTPILQAFRAEVKKFGIGYDTTPKFKCPHCGGTFKQRIPLDGDMFRRAAAP